MATLTIALASGALAYMIGSEIQTQEEEEKKTQAANDVNETVMQYPQFTGTYGNVDSISEILNDPTIIKRVIPDTDLSGVPSWWVQTKTGGSYRIYNPRILNF